MNLPVVIGPEASADLIRAFAWYERHDPALAREFITEIARTLEHIEWFPASYQRIEGDVRRAVAPRFRFGVFYRVMPAEIHIVAILSNRGDPDLVSSRP